MRPRRLPLLLLCLMIVALCFACVPKEQPEKAAPSQTAGKAAETPKKDESLKKTEDKTPSAPGPGKLDVVGEEMTPAGPGIETHSDAAASSSVADVSDGATHKADEGQPPPAVSASNLPKVEQVDTSAPDDGTEKAKKILKDLSKCSVETMCAFMVGLCADDLEFATLEECKKDLAEDQATGCLECSCKCARASLEKSLRDSEEVLLACDEDFSECWEKCCPSDV